MFFLRKKYFLIPVAVFLALVGLCFFSLATINSEFVKNTISSQIARSADAKTEIQEAEIRPFAGEVELHGTKITKEDKDTRFEFVVGRIDAKVSIKKLILRELDFVTVEIRQPTVTIVRTREASSADAPNPLAALVKDSLERISPMRAKKKPDEREFDFVIHDLILTDGSVLYKESRDKAESIVGLEKLKYHATEVSISRFYRLLLGANIEGDLVAGKVRGSFKKTHSPVVSSVSITRLDMTMLNSCIVPMEVFMISSGVLDANAEMRTGGGVVVRVRISGLKIAENPNSPSKRVLFIPVKYIVKHVNRKGGDFDLKFNLSGEGWHTSQDLDELIAGFWQDLWADIMGKGVTSLTDRLREKLSR